MLKQLVVLGVIWVGIASLMWVAVVPTLLSPSTFGWVNIALAVAFVAMAGTVRGARPTTSIARVLYDVEHPSDSRR
jgi:hypothetical protein